MINVNPLTDNEEEFIIQVEAVLKKVRKGDWDKKNFKTYLDSIDAAIEAINKRVIGVHQNDLGIHTRLYFDLVTALALYKSLIVERIINNN